MVSILDALTASGQQSLSAPSKSQISYQSGPSINKSSLSAGDTFRVVFVLKNNSSSPAFIHGTVTYNGNTHTWFGGVSAGGTVRVAPLTFTAVSGSHQACVNITQVS